MQFPQVKPESFVPIFASYCIDYRYDGLSSEFFKAIGYENSYFLATNAGAALPLGYKYCETTHDKDDKDDKKCCPGISEMKTLKKSFVTNLNIALTLKP